MLAFVIKRLGQAVVVMLAVAFIAFILFRFAGDPINAMVGQDTPPEAREKLRVELGLTDPVPVQFARFVGRAATGDFGLSYRQGRPVSTLIKERLPATLELAFVACAFALTLGVIFGVYTGIHKKSFLSRFVMVTSLLGISLPTFLTGIFLILIFSVWLPWLPAYGRGDVIKFEWWSTGLLTISGLKAIVLPAITLGLFQMTLIMRLVRSEMLEVLRTDYIKFARARGLSQRAIHFGHALKNTLVPVMTITGLQLGSIIAFSIITETVFSWPGLGLLFIQSVGVVDIPVMSAYLILIAGMFVVINLIVDMLYFVVDPRLRGSFGGGGGHG